MGAFNSTLYQMGYRFRKPAPSVVQYWSPPRLHALYCIEYDGNLTDYLGRPDIPRRHETYAHSAIDAINTIKRLKLGGKNPALLYETLLGETQ